MVFGWGKKTQEPLKPQSKMSQIKLEQIHEILQLHRDSAKKRIVKQAAPHLEQTKNELLLISNIISHLKNDDLKVEDIDKSLKILVIRAKSEVIGVISRELQKQIPGVSNYEELVEASDAVSRTLKKIGDVLGKHSRVIHVFAKKYAGDLKTHLAAITAQHNALSNLISEFNSLDSSLDTISEKAKKIQSINEQLGHDKTSIEKSQALLADVDTMLKSTQKKIADLFESENYKKFIKYREELGKLLEQENKLNKEINDEFAKISRPLGRYVYVTSLEKPLKIILNQLIETPSETISKNKSAVFIILESCMKGIMSKTVSVKEPDKTISQLTTILSKLDEYVNKKNTITSQINQIQNKMGIFDLQQLEALERQLAKLRQEDQETKTKLKNLEQQIKLQSSQKEGLIADLENTVERILGEKYQITI